MAWNDANELVVASNGQIYVAPVGTAMPATTTEALNIAFIGLGYLTEDGLSQSITPEVTGFRAWQEQQDVRRERKAQAAQWKGALEQWNETNIVLAFGGGSMTESPSGTFRYVLPKAGDALDERAYVIDAQDGDRNIRMLIARANITEAVETTFKADELAVLPITIDALAPTGGGDAVVFLFDDDVAFATGS